MRTSLAILGVVAGAAAVNAAEQHCDDAYECHYFYETTKDLWYWDFRPLCSATEYQYNDKNAVLNDTFHFNICGNAQQHCDPKDWDNPYNYGVAVQMWGETPSCSTPADRTCTDSTDPGEKVCCTAECELLGSGFPVFNIVDENNPETGGINITHTGVPPSTLDPNPCPYDPTTGGYQSRQVVYHMMCDKKGKQGSLTVTDAYEGPQCVYNLNIKTVHACGVVYSGVDSAKSQKKKDGGAIAGAYFGGVATVFAIGGAAYWYFYVYQKGGYSGFGASAASGFTASSAAVGSSSAAYSSVGQ